MSAALSCNTNVSILGSETQAKATLHYLLKYITKTLTEIMNSVSLIYHVRKTIEVHPSVAEDSETERRTAMHFLSRVTNKLSSMGEISSQMAAAALLQMPSETSTHGYFNIYVNAAIDYALTEQNIISDNDASEVSEHSDDGDISDTEMMEEDAIQELSKDGLENLLIQPPQYFSNGAFEEVEIEGHFSSAKIYNGSSGNVVVPQHINYAFRGMNLQDFSLYEYVSIISVVPRSNKEKSGETQGRQTAAGRPANGRFNFHSNHPLFKTHTQQLRSNMKIPVPVKIPPPPPPSNPKHKSRLWFKKANNFAQYMLVLFQPWEMNDGQLPGSLKWNDFVFFYNTLQETSGGPGNMEILRARFRWIENMAHGLKTSSVDCIINKKHRSRVATCWGMPDVSSVFETNAEREMDQVVEPNECIQNEDANAIINQLRNECAKDEIIPENQTKEQIYHENTLSFLRSCMPLGGNLPRIMLSIDSTGYFLNTHDGLSETIFVVRKNLESNKEDSNAIEEIFDDVPGVRDEELYRFAHPENLNAAQQGIYNKCLSYMTKKKDALNNLDTHPKPSQILLHGGPGTGKSYLTHCIYEASKELGLLTICIAPTGNDNLLFYLIFYSL